MLYSVGDLTCSCCSDEEDSECCTIGSAGQKLLMPYNVHDLTCSCCSDEEGSELADLQRVLQKVVSSKKASARQKQAEIIQVTC